MLGRTNSKIISTSLTIALFATPFLGYFYDLIGRRKILIPCAYACGLTLALVPLTAPNITLLTVARVVVALLINTIGVSPLVMDYVKRDSRGRAMILLFTGMALAELSVAVLLQTTAKLPPQ